MRTLIIRKLTASGYEVGIRLKVSGVEATQIKNQLGSSMLLISSVPHGPSWPQIHKSLQKLDSSPGLVLFGKHPAVLVEDSKHARDILGSLSKNANFDRSRQVFLEDVGFVDLDSKSRPNFRLMLLPASSLVLVLVLGTFWNFIEQPSEEKQKQAATVVCIVDSNKPEFNQWLSSSLQSEPALIAGQEVLVNSELGDLKVVVERVIGSAAKVSGSAMCSDGRELKINHRVDISGTGDVLELGQ
jgi:hypothetical protein